MKTKTILFLLLISTAAFSETAKTDNKDKQYGAVTVNDTDGTLKKILALPGVNDAYKNCQANHKLDEVPDCLWNSSLTQQQKDQIKAIYAASSSDQSSNNSRKPASANDKNSSVLQTGLTNKKMDVGIDYSTNPTVKGLTDFYEKKLDEVLYPDKNKEGKISTVDHSKFIELYKSELGKTIINAFTSYCMETPETCRTGTDLCLISGDETTRKDTSNTNLKSLQSVTFSDKEGAGWQKCILDVSKVCYEMSSNDDADKVYSKQRACVVMDFVKSARKSLIAANEQKKFYDEIDSSKFGVANLGSGNFAVTDDKKASSDKLTQLTSEDMKKDFTNLDNKKENIAKVIDQPSNEAKKCLGDDGKISDQAQCKKFLSTDTDKNTAAVTDFGLRQFADGETLDNKLNDKNNVASYLKEEGYSDKEIQNLTKDENIQTVKDQIKDRYKSEKDALIKEMASRIGGKTTTDQGKVTDNDSNKMQTIKNELSTRNTDLQNLIHFNNIVSSYLSVVDTNTKKASRNTASLYSEVQSYTGDGAEELKKNLGTNGKNVQQGDNNSQLSIDDINKNFLNYKTNDDSTKSGN